MSLVANLSPLQGDEKNGSFSGGVEAKSTNTQICESTEI